ncbi:sensor histidine kinase [Streptomyces sp. NPDC059063]|uniref:sensor histidine kinase n=1 Tax=unclassified Streptomyces TaxID=2593676 RepID=UPI0036BB6A66
MGRGARGPARGGPGAADVAVPALLLAGHLAVVLHTVNGPGRGAAWQPSLGVLVAAVAATALVWRRTAPVPVCCAVVVADAVARVLLPEPALPVMVWVALFSVAVHRRALTATALAVLSLPFYGVGIEAGGRLLDELLAGALTHCVVLLCGRLRAHRTARRARVLARLADVERERRAAAAAERERLARDLHDTAGHHLTAVAVQSAAALRLADTRPELADAALASGAATGRDVLAALGKLVPVVGDAPDDGPLHELVPPLCAGLERLGIPVTLALHGHPYPLRPDTSVVAYRVVQESLTNAMRYAAGAPVSVRIGYAPGELTVTVTNGPSHGPSPGDDAPLSGSGSPGLGTGRGVAGMRERVAGAGGRVTAGPGERGGWTVTATLPTEAGGWARRGRAAWVGRRGAVVPRLRGGGDVVVFVGCVVVPVGVGAVVPSGAGLVGLVGLAAAHAAPLFLRRRAPATALAATLAVALGWAAATAAGLLAFDWLGALAVAGAAELVGLHAVGAYGPARATWPAPVAVGLVGGTVLGLAAASDPAESAGPATVALLAALGLAAVPWLLPVWALGLLTRARRGEGGRWERHVLDAVAARVGDAVTSERRRVATGLHATVVEHTVRLVRAADAGLAGGAGRRAALAEVTDAARGALAGLRELLDAMDELSESDVRAARVGEEAGTCRSG